ncbi:MAG: Non-heme chloroperoxidase [Candidatus Hydrogenedentes bacterium ADurb.Bin101]|nr:alpha/beta hydrolase [Candidatus Hydrogenedentota bacterium]OQC06846.1 MAG: Non-heme chloroperoxidase [Candidatus Hydrogenedentes bacterium ADurb.Bin101]
MRLRTTLFIGTGSVLLVLLLLAGIFLYVLLHRTPGAYFESNGVRIFYSVEGSGTPLILVHGIGVNADLNWRRPGVTRMLAKNFQVISYDLRGHGRSDKPEVPAAYGVKMAEDIVRLMDHLEIRRAHVAGYSLGGFLALKAVSLHPDRFISASICAAGWKDPNDPSPLPNPYKPPENTDTRKVETASVFAAATPKSLFNRIRGSIGDRIISRPVRTALKAGYQELAVEQSLLEKNTVPMLNIIGDHDGLLPLAHDLVAVTANLEAREIPGATHFSLPFKKAFKEGLREFLLRHDKKAVPPGS